MERSRVTEPRKTALPCGSVSGFIMGLVSRLSLVSYLAWPIFGLTEDSSWGYAYLSAKIESREKDSGRLAEDMD